ncbi:hypothetical protein FEM48_Zijuj05G0135300 [Ziziphus jujuba var. spinosa]|uniref:Uncharacterized protein n=1 Tax=Ziziphus jujuba var. spinosa TaxID=714518 RepID=A0A978VF44_ZIZJJ|nr:hypothetical protein FEM48_Zijuj05G0135300 [Ziziphus jujuba var. spinosa]
MEVDYATKVGAAFGRQEHWAVQLIPASYGEANEFGNPIRIFACCTIIFTLVKSQNGFEMAVPIAIAARQLSNLLSIFHSWKDEGDILRLVKYQ